MSTHTLSFPNCDLKTDTGFRLLIEHIQEILDDVNSGFLSKTSDTGQVNPLSVTTPYNSSSNSVEYNGFNIYKFDDSIQNIFIRFDYGVYGFGNTTGFAEYCIKAELGTGSDGSGNITGSFLTTTLRAAPHGAIDGLSDRGTHSSYACVKDGFLAISFEVGANISTVTPYPNSTLSSESHTLIISRQNSDPCFSILSGSGFEVTNPSISNTQTYYQRKRDLSIFVVDLSNNTSYYSQIVKSDNCAPHIPGITGVQGADIGVYRLPVISHSQIYNDKNILLYYANDFSHATQMTVDIDAVNSNFIFLTPALRCMYPLVSIAIRWE